jgi:hypothetical protein
MAVCLTAERRTFRPTPSLKQFLLRHMTMGQSGRVKLWEIAILARAKTADMIADIFMIQENSEMK